MRFCWWNFHQVIEYIRFLQEKAQNYESSYPGSNQDEIKLMPWVESLSSIYMSCNIVYKSAFIIWALIPTLCLLPHHVFFSSECFQQKKNPASENASQIIRNDSAAPAQILSEKLENMPSTMVGSPATDAPAGNSCKTTEVATRFASNMAIHDQSPWSVRSCREMLNEREELALDEGTISVSAAYSHGYVLAYLQILRTLYPLRLQPQVFFFSLDLPLILRAIVWYLIVVLWSGNFLEQVAEYTDPGIAKLWCRSV